MYLVASAATGQLAQCIAEEGGVSSASWAGELNKKEIKKRIQDINLSVQTEVFRYDLKFGTAGDVIKPGFFEKDLDIKREKIYLLKGRQKKTLLDRGKALVAAWDSEGRRLDYTKTIIRNESVLTGLRDPHRFTDLSKLRQELLDWRFYHHFRTDPDSLLRKPQLTILTPIMSHDGIDFVAALATIKETSVDEGAELQSRIAEAFPGSRIAFLEDNGRLKLRMHSPEFFRPLELPELSDGTIQYLCLLAALMSQMPPAVLALNEPETSIHPRLLEPLAKLILRASKESQIWITTHSQDLSDYILDMSGYEPLELKKVDGETRLVGVGLGGYKEEEDDAEDQADDEAEDEAQDEDVEETGQRVP